MASLREMVYEQWLHADLRDVVVQPSIPASVAEQQTTSITGQFVVQVFPYSTEEIFRYSHLQNTWHNNSDLLLKNTNIYNIALLHAG